MTGKPAASRALRSERTRERILKGSLALFRKRGVAATSMRDIAKSAGVSLGAAYYYFASKEAIVLSYYEGLVADHERRCAEIFSETDDLGERIRGLYHAKLDILARDRKLIGVLVGSTGDPESPVSVFAAETAHIRARAIAVCRAALAVPAVPESLRADGALGLWTLLLGLILYFIHDSSPRQERTRSLVDGAVDLIVPLAPLLSLPQVELVRSEIARLLAAAGLSERAPL
jgi:AcrR family transcriptional regulator